MKYPFREEYVHKILNKYEENKGLYQIHLRDLPPYYKLEFNKEGYRMFSQILNKVKQHNGLDTIKRKQHVDFYSLQNFLNYNQKGLTVKKILSFIKFLNNKINIKINIQKLEKTVIAISRGRGNKLKLKGLPIRLNNKKWAIIIGSILDSRPKTFDIMIENKHFKKSLSKGLKKLGIKTTSINEKNGAVKIRGHNILGTILSLSGINVNQRQLIANNLLPYWIFDKCNKNYHSIILSKILDTEGHSNKNKPHIRIAQSSLMKINQKERKFIFENSNGRIMPSGTKTNVLIYSKLSRNLKKKVLKNPSLILLSTQLLLRKYKINSTMYPINVYISSNNICSISWHLSINTFQDVKRFYKEFGEYISIPYKKENILNSLKQHYKTQPNINKNLRKVYYLLHALEIEKKEEYFTIKKITKICEKKNKTIYNGFGELIANDYILKIGKEGRFNKLKISQKGRELLKDYPSYEEFKNLLF